MQTKFGALKKLNMGDFIKNIAMEYAVQNISDEAWKQNRRNMKTMKI